MPLAAALGALAHLATLLDRLVMEVARGEEVVARLIARAHLETSLVALYLALERRTAYDKLVGSYKQNLGKQQRGLADSDERRVARASALGLDASDDDAIGIDLSEAISLYGDFEDANLGYLDMARAIAQHAKQRGESGDIEGSAYHLGYRFLSNHGAHPSIWVLDRYIGVSGDELVPHARADMPAMGDAMIHAAVALTAVAAREVFDVLGADTTFFSELLASMER